MAGQNKELTTSLRILFKKMHKVFCALAQENGMASAQLAALRILWEFDGLAISELSEKLLLKNSSMTTLIDRMERDGYVRREREKDDRRVVRVYLTDKGFEVKNLVPDFETHFMDMIKGDLSGSEINMLVLLLNKLSSAIK